MNIAAANKDLEDRLLMKKKELENVADSNARYLSMLHQFAADVKKLEGEIKLKDTKISELKQKVPEVRSKLMK